MKSFNPALLTHAFKQLTVYEREVAHEKNPDNIVPDEFKGDVQLTLTTVKIVATAVGLPETKGALIRLEVDLKSTAERITCVRLQFALHHLLALMESELEKRMVFTVDPEKTKYYQDDILGVKPAPIPLPNALSLAAKKRDLLLSEGATIAFPSAYMDMVEAGRCLALNRNNAAIYHLMQVAEIGLRTLAWDRRVTIKRGKHRDTVPLDYAQWGEMIGDLEKKKLLIHQWNRAKSLRDEAFRYYSRAIFEIDSFNEIFRKHSTLR